MICNRFIHGIYAVWLALFLSGCGLLSSRIPAPVIDPVLQQDLSSVPDAVPRTEPKSRYGNPKSYVVFGRRYYVMPSADGFSQQGRASWYGRKFHGRRTSSGETYDMYKMTAAHKTLPLPTYVRVRHIKNNKTVVVRVNDRGPFHGDRIIDLSYAAASRLDMVGSGTAEVEVQLISGADAAQPPDTILLPPEGNGNLYVQVGAYRDKQAAERFSTDMRDRYADGSGVHVRSADVAGVGQLHKVLIGPFTESKAAGDMLTGLLRDGVSGFILRRQP